MQVRESNLTVARVFVILRRRAPVVLLCFVVAVAVSVAYSLSATKKYTATAALVFNNTPLSQQVAGLQAVVNTNAQSEQDTNTQLLKLGNLAQATATRIGGGLTTQAVAGSIGIAPQSDTTVVSVSSTLPSATMAARVANTYAQIFVNQQENVDHQYYASALATVERQIAKLSPVQAEGAQGLALQNRAQSLATLAQLRTGTVSLAQAATVPAAASSPRTTRNALVAGLLGLLLGIALAVGIERLDQRIREPEELERVYELPLLGAVPQSPTLRRSGRESASVAPAGVITDAFQFIRSRLRYFNVDRDLHTVAVVSCQPGDGKTTIAHWLASASASLGSRTLLVEADLRRPTMAQEIGLESGPGLANVLIGACTLEDATQTAQILTGTGPDQKEHSLDVVVAGGLPPNPAEMLESLAMLEVLGSAKAGYDLVVIDTPPLGAVSDALPLVKSVDGVVIVAGMGRNHRAAAQRLKATLTSVNAPLLGVIANQVKSSDRYAYGYEYEYSSERVDRPVAASEPSGGGVAAETSPTTVETRRHNVQTGGGTPGSNGSTPSRVIDNGRVEAVKGAHQPTANRSTSRKQHRLVIYRLGSIGDTVAALPCFHLIEQSYPDSERIVLTNMPVSANAAPLETVLKDGGFIHGTIPYPLGTRDPRQLSRLAKLLRDQRADTLIYLAASRGLGTAARDVTFFKLCGFTDLIGVPASEDLQANRIDEVGNLERESHRLARTLSSLGTINLVDRAWWDLRLTREEHAVAANRLGDLSRRPFVAVNTGGKSPRKDWGAYAWRSLLASLGQRLEDWGLVFVGGHDDQSRAAELRESWPGAAVDLCGSLTPRESAAALSRAAMFVGHDSGALHLADAVGTPAVGIFGDYNKPKMWHPSGDRTRVIHQMSGLKDVSPAHVLRETTHLLEPVGRAERQPGGGLRTGR